MKKLLWVALGAALAVSMSAVAWVGGLPNPAIFTGTVSSIKACASGFTRAGPNYCQRTDVFVGAAAPGTCTAVTLPDASAKALVYAYTLIATTANAIGNRQPQLLFWSESSCAVTNVSGVQCIGRENPAEASGAGIVCGVSGTTVTPVVSGALWESSASTGGAGGSIVRQIRGYYD